MKTKTFKILAIESSCDETAAAVIHVTCSKKHVTSLDIKSNIISSQVKLHAKYGGVYPELASREHIKNIIPVIEQSLNTVKKPFSIFQFHDIDYLAVTIGPGLIGSLLVGVNTAKTLAYTLKKPIYSINHLEGHIYSCFLNKFPISLPRLAMVGNLQFPKFPLLALIVSGGHTSLVYMKNHLDFKTIGETLDDAAGEAFDKVAMLLGLGYPGGPAIAEMAAAVESLPAGRQGKKLKVKSRIRFPRPMINSKDFNFSFSGLKTAVLYAVKKIKSTSPRVSKLTKQLICKEFQDAVVETLVTKTLKAAQKCKVKSVFLCGGVSANKELHENLRLRTCDLGLKFFAPAKNLFTDNAAMIGIACAYKIMLGKKPSKWYDVNANANQKL